MRRHVALIDGLTERQRLAVHLLAQGKTIREVSRTLHVSEKTIYNYRQKPAVQNAIFQCQQDMMEQSGGQTLTSVPSAMQCLSDIVNDPDARDADRIAASKALLSSANSFAERRILERQLADLEQTLRTFTSGEKAVIEPADSLDPLLASADPEDGD